MAMGGLLWSGAVALATEGSLTGAGPQDPRQRKLLEATGWRPYSMRVQKADGSTAYVSFARMDPFAGFLGMAADYTELAGGMSNDDMWETAGKAMIVTLKQLQLQVLPSGAYGVLGRPDEPRQGRGEARQEPRGFVRAERHRQDERRPVFAGGAVGHGRGAAQGPRLLSGPRPCPEHPWRAGHGAGAPVTALGLGLIRACTVDGR